MFSRPDANDVVMLFTLFSRGICIFVNNNAYKSDFLWYTKREIVTKKLAH